MGQGASGETIGYAQLAREFEPVIRCGAARLLRRDGPIHRRSNVDRGLRARLFGPRAALGSAASSPEPVRREPGELRT